MKKMWGSIVLSLGLLAALGLPAPAAAHPGGEHFRVTARTISETYKDQGKKGWSRGDSFAFTEKLMQNGDRVGRDYGKCDVTRVTKRTSTAQCSLHMTFKGEGQLIAEGAVTFRRGSKHDPRLAITGGTGDYADASGVFVLMERRGEPTRYGIHLMG